MSPDISDAAQKAACHSSNGVCPVYRLSVLSSRVRYYQAQKLVPGGNTPCAYSPTGARYGAVALVPTEWDRLLEAARKVRVWLVGDPKLRQLPDTRISSLPCNGAAPPDFVQSHRYPVVGG